MGAHTDNLQVSPRYIPDDENSDADIEMAETLNMLDTEVRLKTCGCGRKTAERNMMCWYCWRGSPMSKERR